MNIKILDSWLREYLQTPATPANLQTLVSLSGPAIERIEATEDDFVYDIEFTTNRIDSVSVYGFAREAATILKHQGFAAQLLPYKTSNLEVGQGSVVIEDQGKLCKRILVLEIDNVKVAQSPEFIKKRLEAAGIRSLNNLIDITNYVMLELGHPVHVFDLDRIKTNKLVVRLAQKGESAITLDGKKHELNAEDVIIDDGTGRIIDLPGIMGCENSVVNEATKRILVFVESNDPVRIRKTSMKHAIRTLAATYNENEPDQELAKEAVSRCATLYQELANGQIKGRLLDLNYVPAPRKTVSLTNRDVESYMGKKISNQEIIAILRDLGFVLESDLDEKMLFIVPAFRHKDVSIKEDLIEEVARIYGYGNLPTVLPPFKFISDEYIRALDAEYKVEKRLKLALADLGFFELYNYSMISNEEQAQFSLPEKPIRMQNPMSQELVCFRQSLVPSLVKNALLNKTVSDLKIFEVANVYLPRANNLPLEEKTLGLIIRGNFSLLKSFTDALMQLGYINYSLSPVTQIPYLEVGEGVALEAKGEKLGYLGVLSRKLLYALGLSGEYVVAEVKLSLLAKLWQTQKSIVLNQDKNFLIEDLTYKFNGQTTWVEITKALKNQFAEVKNIEYVTEFEGYITMRLYSQSKQSLLEKIYEYLETELELEIKRVKVDNNKS